MMERKTFGPTEKINPDYYFVVSVIFIDTCKRADFICRTEDEAQIFVDEMQEEIDKNNLMNCGFTVDDAHAKLGNPRKIFFCLCWSEPRIVLGTDGKARPFNAAEFLKDQLGE